MNHSPSKRVAWEKQQPARRSRAKLHAIHDGPFVFRVKSHRSSSNHPDDDASDSSSDRNKPSKRSTSIPSARDPPYCNWKNFMKRKSRYGKCSYHSDLCNPLHLDEFQAYTPRMRYAILPVMSKSWNLDPRSSTTVDITAVLNVDTNARSIHWQCM